MRKWFSLPVACLLLLGASQDAAAALGCGVTPGMSPSLRAAEQKTGCKLNVLAAKCAKAADEKKLAGQARSDFIVKCEGFHPPAKKRPRR